MAWLWCWSSKPTRPPVAARARQVGLLADAYDVTGSPPHAAPASR
jgi:hypothetical protein